MFLKKRIYLATDNMLNLFELAGGLSHNGEKGTFREYFVSEVVRPCIPNHFGISSGIIVDAWGKQSRQTDLIIYDQRMMPPILETGSTGIIPMDSVMAVLEVKSTLKSSHLSTLVNAAWKLHPDNADGLKMKAKGTLDNGKSFYPLYAIFGYQSDADDKDEVERLKEQTGKDLDFIKLICVLNKGVWSRRKGVCLSDDPKENMLGFLINFLNKVEKTAQSRGEFLLSDWLKT